MIINSTYTSLACQVIIARISIIITVLFVPAIGAAQTIEAHDNSTIQCISCALYKGEITCIGGIVAATQYFLVQQDYTVPIPGFMIISSTRHIQSIDEFTAEERTDFIELLYKVRHAMKDTLGIRIIDLIQEEDSDHFHIWLFPWYQWMHTIGTKIQSVKPIMQWAKNYLNTPENLRDVEQVAHMLRDYMVTHHSR